MKPKFWFVIAGMTAVLALLIAMVTIFSTGTGPRAYVAKNYTRAVHLDKPGDDDNKAYTSRLKPSTVVDDITDSWEPISQYARGSGVYLRYSEDAVIVQPRDRGSVIHVMELDEAYNHYHHVVGGVWGWGGPRGQTFRGGGPGSGK
ncbi:DUF4247 domain-containing protein [Actinopolyspora erythraea]|uniref:DUF4247 domain-containing protein n=1 Tax=Actinopolyspora erythraea TaxID=414996 RepID=A0A099D2R6_9ACTN|nr:DUF4247 domain-containing protein [Actinopolyspora erythraea]ASU77260.1 DUF4247 domain-containing protein [Actinopolyspora erythraea]KGI80251.1 hypothetical protein IL38_19145 [Actinopolyspora erythraea]